MSSEPQRDPFERALAASWPPAAWRDLSIVVAVSGGADSVALVRGLHALKAGGRGSMALAHYNHRWRGVESDEDEAFVRNLAAQLGLSCHCDRAPDNPVQPGGEGAEATARRDRYAFLTQAASTAGARYVVAAHTADDQAETILHRIIRGTGVAGLTGMPRARPLGEWATLIRPLLGVRRNAVEAYLHRLAQPHRDDSSNRDLHFMRNRIRHELLPLLAERYNPAVVESLLKLGSVASDAQQAIRQMAESLHGRSVERQTDGSLRIDCKALADQPIHLVREVCVVAWDVQQWPRQQMGLAQWNELAEAILAPEGDLPARVLPGNIRFQRKGQQCFLAPQGRGATRSDQ